MRRLIKKEDRLAVQTYEFNHMLEQAFTQENYKTLVFFTKDEDRHFSLKVFRGTAAKPIQWCFYRSIDQRTQAIANYKQSEDRRIAYKAECKNNPKKSPAANAAQAIREELKENFPGVKFSVTSENFSMGNSVNIHWEDGPTEKNVTEITGKYQYGHFDGMEDIYENSNSRDDIPQAKYVHESRKMSAQTKSILEPIAAELFKGDDDHNQWSGNQLYRIFQKTSIPVGAKILGIERTEITHGSREDFYFINYETAHAEQKQSPEIEKTEVKPGEVSIIEYGAHQIAVIGDTKPIKDKLGKNGLKGWFNVNLSCGPGWLFPKRRLEEIQQALTQEMKNEYVITDKPEQPTMEVKEYETLEDITKAAHSGQVVSLLNLYNLVNKKSNV